MSFSLQLSPTQLSFRQMLEHQQTSAGVSSSRHTVSVPASGPSIRRREKCNTLSVKRSGPFTPGAFHSRSHKPGVIFLQPVCEIARCWSLCISPLDSRTFRSFSQVSRVRLIKIHCNFRKDESHWSERDYKVLILKTASIFRVNR